MPEGPSIVILKEDLKSFTGKKVLSAEGNAKIDFERLINKKVIAFKTYGKHFLICFRDFTVRIHLLMFGKYSINERRKNRKEKLSLKFPNGEVNFYAGNVKILEGNINDIYDWSSDVMNSKWDTKQAKSKMKKRADKPISDVLLDQDVFAGVGNIIKNEVLYRARVHPESVTGKIPPAKRNKIVDEVRNYSFDFLKWKKKYELKKHWEVYTKKKCPRCDLPIHKKYTGKNQRRSFFCSNCQKLYT